MSGADYDLKFNILWASVTPREQGLLALGLSGEEDHYDRAIAFLAAPTRDLCIFCAGTGRKETVGGTVKR